MKISEVIWYDAVSKDITKEAIEEIRKAGKNVSGKDLLSINTTYGEVFELKDVVVIITERSTSDDTGVTIIPKDWIISIK